MKKERLNEIEYGYMPSRAERVEMVAEIRKLRGRVADLEADNVALRARSYVWMTRVTRLEEAMRPFADQGNWEEETAGTLFVPSVPAEELIRRAAELVGKGE